MGHKMKTLLLVVGLVMSWEDGQVLGDKALSDKALSDRELQGKWATGPLCAHSLLVRPQGLEAEWAPPCPSLSLSSRPPGRGSLWPARLPGLSGGIEAFAGCCVSPTASLPSPRSPMPTPPPRRCMRPGPLGPLWSSPF